MGSSSSSSSELPDLLMDSLAFLFVRSSILLYAFWLTVLGVDRVPGTVVLVPIGVVKFSGPPFA